MSERVFVSVGVGVLTVSDTRRLEEDTSGALVVERLERMGHEVVDRRLVRDEVGEIQGVVRGWMGDGRVSVGIVTGGTGVTARDVTPEAVGALGTKRIEGFGELFRWLSYREIGTSTIQSRADAWLCGETLVFVLPGSTGAVRLAMDEILAQQLDARHRPCNFIELLPRIRGER